MLIGEFAVGDCDEDARAKLGMLVLEPRSMEEFDRVVGDGTFASEPLLPKIDPGRSPNFGKANWKSLLLAV